MKTLLLTHGAGSDRNSPLLLALESAFAGSVVTVMRVNLPFRENRPHGPPVPGDAVKDRAALRSLAAAARASGADRVWMGGHSYGGRQSTMLAAEDPNIADALLLLSYPLHPPRKPLELRTRHFPDLRTPALFVHGARDPFGTLDEMREALKRIPSTVRLLEWEGAGHDLRTKRRESFESLARRVADEFLAFID